MPQLPPDVPKDADTRVVLLDKAPTGQDAVWKSADGTIHEFFQFNDRGGGPKIYTNYRVDRSGMVISEESNGVDYIKTPVTESFLRKSGVAVWKNQSEDEKQPNAEGKFYIDINGGPESQAILAHALLNAKSEKVAVLPSAARSCIRIGTSGLSRPANTPT